MGIAFSWIASQLSKSILSALAVLVLLRALFGFVLSYKTFESESSPLWLSLQWAIWSLPQYALDFFVFSVLIGALVAIGQLVNDQAITVLRTHGLSLWRLNMWFLVIIFSWFLAATGVREFVTPYTNHQANQITALSSASTLDESLLKVSDGYWLRVDDGFLHIRHVGADETLHDLTHYKMDASDLLSIRQIKTAVNLEAQNEWLLADIQQLLFSEDGKVAEQQSIVSETWQVNIPVQLLALSPTRLSLTELLAYRSYLADQSLNTRSYDLRLIQLLLEPLNLALLIALITGFLMRQIRQSLTARLLQGVGLGFVLFVLIMLSEPLTMQLAWPVLVAGALPSLCLMTLNIWIYSR